jgi:outer membrane protein assembly factor BamB
VWRDRAYFIRSGGVLACRDTTNGKMVFEERIGAPGGYYASPVAADGRLYLTSDQGMITVVKAGDKLEVLARNEIGEPVLASPALAGNTLYVRSAKHLWAFGEGAN